MRGAPIAHHTMADRILARMTIAIAAAAALAAVINAYSFSMVTAIPLVQSDVWRFLDGFLGRFLEHGFVFADLLRQENAADTNLPLQKLLLFFHTRFMGMDFRVEGAFGTLAGIAMVAVMAKVAARRPLSQWTSLEYSMLAVLALTQLTLNSTNVFTWPLATLWFVPMLMATLFYAYVWTRPDSRWGLFVVSLTLGILLDEVAFPVFAAVLVAAVVGWRYRHDGQLKQLATFGIAGIAVSRIVYWWFNRGIVPLKASTPRSFEPLLSPEVWKAGAIPLSDSLIHFANLPLLFEQSGAAVGVAITIVLAILNLWFWERVLRTRSDIDPWARAATKFAASIMLLCYALVFGIVIQRVPTFGFDYLHQPRYTMFYALNIAAIVLMAYRELTLSRRGGRVLAAVLPIVLAALITLQWKLSLLAWEHAKYLSVYVQGVAQSMGKLQREPASQMQCADIMTVCEQPPAKRAELMNRLARYRMNIFSPEFQAFHRLSPTPPPAAEVEAGAEAQGDGGVGVQTQTQAEPEAQ